MKYIKIHTALVGPITFWGFLRKKYFFIFIDEATRETDTYTRKEKSQWFNYLKTYYAQAQTILQTNQPIYYSLIDFGSKLQSIAVVQWILAKDIIFGPFTTYS